MLFFYRKSIYQQLKNLNFNLIFAYIVESLKKSNLKNCNAENAKDLV